MGLDGEEGHVETATLPTPEETESGDDGPRTPVFGGDPRAVSLSLAEGETIPTHEHPGTTVLLLVRSGTASVTVGGTAHAVEADGLLKFDGDAGVAVEARTACTALVVLSETDSS